MPLRSSKRELAFQVLDSLFGSPSNQKRGWKSEQEAVDSAATVLASRVGVSFGTARGLVVEWYGRSG